MLVVSGLYGDVALSFGQSAQIVGILKRAFVEMLVNYRLSVLSISIPDLHPDLANA